MARAITPNRIREIQDYFWQKFRIAISDEEAVLTDRIYNSNHVAAMQAHNSDRFVLECLEKAKWELRYREYAKKPDTVVHKKINLLSLEQVLTYSKAKDAWL